MSVECYFSPEFQSIVRVSAMLDFGGTILAKQSPPIGDWREIISLRSGKKTYVKTNSPFFTNLKSRKANCDKCKYRFKCYTV